MRLSHCMIRPLSMLALLSLTFGVSCTTMPPPHTRQAVSEREDVLLQQAEMRRLSGRIEGVELEVERLLRTVNQLQTEQTQWIRSQQQQMETRLTALESQLQALDAARESDRKAIIEQLTTTVAELLREQRGAGGTRAASGYGYEHTVGAGETLSHIAAAYGVTTRAIIAANNLENPDRLRIGQKLFIPE